MIRKDWHLPDKLVYRVQQLECDPARQGGPSPAAMPVEPRFGSKGGGHS